MELNCTFYDFCSFTFVMFLVVAVIVVNSQNGLYISKYEKYVYSLLLDEVFYEYQLDSID